MDKLAFNIKWNDFLAKGHYGLDINNQDVAKYLDKRFEELTKLPDFKYYQIKTKYGFVTLYCDGLTTQEIYDEECAIQDILDESYKTF